MHPRYPSLATAVTALLAQACGLVATNPDPGGGTSQTAGSSGQSTGGAATGVSGALASGSGGIDLTTPCAPKVMPFEGQVVEQVGEQRVFYSWTTEEQIAELRSGGELFSRRERPGEGPGLLFSELAALAQSPANGPQPALAYALVNELFATARFAWPNPWATRLGFPGESYGNQLLRIELRPEAWIARFEGGDLSVYDTRNELVPLEQALVTPERIGAIFFQSRAEDASMYCGTFSRGAIGFREFALGNLDMVAIWSLATPEIAERLQSDIAELQAFEQQLACFGDTGSWSTDVACAWGSRWSSGLLTNYEFALGLPNELYRPTSENIQALVAALRDSRPTGKPLTVIRLR